MKDIGQDEQRTVDVAVATGGEAVAAPAPATMLTGAAGALGRGALQRKLAQRRMGTRTGMGPPVQAAGRVATAAAATGPVVHDAAARGVAGGGCPLPYLDQIQRSFGRHDVGGIEAHVGSAAHEAASAIGARAYATGNKVAFGEAPDLHTAAHEAAHVLQQRQGVHLKDGVGEAGDEHERHADAVADRVVRGESAEALLDERVGAGGGAAVQRVHAYSNEQGEGLQVTSGLLFTKQGKYIEGDDAKPSTELFPDEQLVGQTIRVHGLEALTKRNFRGEHHRFQKHLMELNLPSKFNDLALYGEVTHIDERVVTIGDETVQKRLLNWYRLDRFSTKEAKKHQQQSKLVAQILSGREYGEGEGYRPPKGQMRSRPLKTFEDKGKYSQGWKLHVSAPLDHVSDVLSVALPLLLKLGADHKVAPYEHYLSLGNTQDGKLIAIYPENDDHLIQIVTALEEQFSELKLQPQGGAEYELQIGKSGLVSTRFGQFISSGTDMDKQLVGPGKKLEPDDRYQTHPKWAEMPEQMEKLVKEKKKKPTLQTEEKTETMPYFMSMFSNTSSGMKREEKKDEPSGGGNDTLELDDYEAQQLEEHHFNMKVSEKKKRVKKPTIEAPSLLSMFDKEKKTHTPEKTIDKESLMAQLEGGGGGGDDLEFDADEFLQLQSILSNMGKSEKKAQVREKVPLVSSRPKKTSSSKEERTSEKEKKEKKKVEVQHQTVQLTQIACPYTIGRSSECSLKLHNTTQNVSRKHLTITKEKDEFFVTDSSRFGTQLNGDKVDKGKTPLLKHGDILLLGGEVEIKISLK